MTQNLIKQPTTENIDFILYFLPNDGKLLWKSQDRFLCKSAYFRLRLWVSLR